MLLDLLKKCFFFTEMTFFNFNSLNAILLSVNSLECVSMNNQKCKTLTSLCFIPIVLQ